MFSGKLKDIKVLNWLAIILVIIVVWLGNGFPGNKSEKVEAARNQETGQKQEVEKSTVITDGLSVPWGMVTLPDGGILLTERAGRVKLVDLNMAMQPEIVHVFENVKVIGEGGLLGIALHPDFSSNRIVYVYYTYGETKEGTLNRVVKMTYKDKEFSDESIVVDKIPGSSNHNGGRIKFGSDGYLYITTGDAENPSQAQDKEALGGKILRVTDEGKAVEDNPFGNLVYSYGHRNPQGITWDESGQLWSTEHGPSGGQYGFANDELNLIIKGHNYGWPIIKGMETKEGLETPKAISGSKNTWAPADMAFVNGSLYFVGLKGEALYKVDQINGRITVRELLKNKYGRLREVILGPDNLLYLATSNRDGRGIPALYDDRILRLSLESFQDP